MSGSFFNPYALTGGAGYKANTSLDEYLRKNSGIYRKYSVSARAMEEDRRASQIDPSAIAEAAEGATGRRSSLAVASGGAAVLAAGARKGSVIVGSTVERRDSVFGLEASAGTNMDPNRRVSTSLAADLYHKIKGDRKSSVSAPSNLAQVAEQT
jgi:hypothetical protein